MTRLAVMMMVALVALMPLLSGCGTGFTRTFFATKTNVGLEVSTTPPTAELAISQIEGVVSPQFENGKKLPVMSSFRFDNRGFFSPAVGSAFATGDAAKTMAALYKDKTPVEGWEKRITKVTKNFPGDSTLILDGKPTVMRWLPSWLEWARPKFQENDVRPVFFGTTTALGVKVAWSGMTGQIPDTAVFGYNRKELALVPISMQKVKNSGGKDEYRMKQASLLATLDSATNLSTDEDDRGINFQLIQYFATGDAANLLALQQDVRKSMLARLDPHGVNLKELKESKFSEDDSSKQVRGWLFQGGQVNTNNRDALRGWMDQPEIGLKDLAIAKLLDNALLKDHRTQAIKDLNIPPLTN